MYALHPAVEQRLANLAPDQRAAATALPGPVLCVAPAGSGKTTTLVARICWLLATGNDPATITAITFNARAAAELRERLAAAVEPFDVPPETLRVRTFHALGREIGIERSTERNVHQHFTKSWKCNFNITSIQKRRYIQKRDALHLPVTSKVSGSTYQACGRVKVDRGELSFGR